jgi:RNA polymerase sigma factor (sigma-70 family)
VTTGLHAPEAEWRLEREYEPLKASTLRALAAKLRGQGLELPLEDLDAYYNQAWHALYTQAAEGATIENTAGFLVQVAFRRAIDDVRRQRIDERADVPVEDLGVVAQDDVVERLEDQRRLRELVEAFRDELGERERVAATLCYVHGYSRPEAARLMGLSERRLQKVMDVVSKVVGRVVRDIEAGDRCEQRRSLNKAYALGLLDPDGERYASARAHLETCSRCRADVLAMRGLAVVTPAPLLPWAAMHVAGAGAGGAEAARPRRVRRPRPRGRQAAAAGVAGAVLAAAVAFAVARDGGDTPHQAARRPATAPTAKAPPPAAASPRPSANTPAAKPHARTTTAKRHPRRKATTAPAGTTTTSTAPPAATTTQPAAAGTPKASTPVTTHAPAATTPSAPAVLDDGVQEFGVEP